jgi:class 3 adenylate cyclase
VLSDDIQRKLAQRYGGEPLQKMVKYAFEQRLVKALKDDTGQPTKEDVEAFSAIVFIDVASFSERVNGMDAAGTRRFLDTYYAAVIPEIYERRGHIDRIVGDGILAVYSPHLSPDLTDQKAEESALAVAEAVVEKLHSTQHVCKAAISVGDVLYCKTGLAQVYEDYTIIGEPLTTAYRLEEVAEANQVLVPTNSVAGRKISNQLARRRASEAQGVPLTAAAWLVKRKTIGLRGIGDADVYIQTFQ